MLSVSFTSDYTKSKNLCQYASWPIASEINSAIKGVIFGICGPERLTMHCLTGFEHSKFVNLRLNSSQD